jgi:hypothetical protein
MTKSLGPTFGDEVIAAGLQDAPFSWGKTSDDILRGNLTEAQNTTLDGVIEAHDPSKQPAPVVQQDTQVLYEHENRLRALEGQPPLSLGEFVVQKTKM